MKEVNSMKNLNHINMLIINTKISIDDKNNILLEHFINKDLKDLIKNH